MNHIILGTAGHIDHGKSSLVKALTGVDPDRLKEEKERGITIDIGFADLLYPENGLSVGIVDVPGHEKLIRNMLAGAGGIDMVLLVIAADEGVMPQSREHLAICNLLKIESGLVVITKSDLVEKEWLALVTDEVREFVRGTFLEGAVIVPVSSRTGDNLDLLKNEILKTALRITPKTSEGLFRLPIDRVFTLKGFGTVVTGTAVSGRISVEDPIEILPADIKTKVRGLHSHGRPIDTAYAGQRVAINLQGVEKEDLKRGDVAVTPGSFISTRVADVFFEHLPEAPVLKNRSLVHFYSGTAETVARVIFYDKDELKAGESCYCRFRLKDNVIIMSGDRYIIRRFSPLETLGGGEILDPLPARRRIRDGIADLIMLHKGSLDEKISFKIEKAGGSGIQERAIRGWLKAEPWAVSASIENLQRSGLIMKYENTLYHSNAFRSLQHGLLELLRSFHQKNPLKHGMSKEEIRNQLKTDAGIFGLLLSRTVDIVVDQSLVRLKEFRIALSTTEEMIKTKIVDLVEKGGFQPPSKDDIASSLRIEPKRLADILSILAKEGKIVRINETIYLSAFFYNKMICLLKDFYAKKKDMSVAEFRDMLNTSRKFALPFLEFLDSGRITMRTGDVRKFLPGNCP